MHDVTHENLWAAIDDLARRHGLSPSALARCSGLDATSFNRSKRWTAQGRTRWPSTESLAKVLRATGTSLTELVQRIELMETRKVAPFQSAAHRTPAA